jgi:DNA-binding winged helix-turn-helix (wHTH) protein/tetratricopeptide (TPR) repeat protein
VKEFPPFRLDTDNQCLWRGNQRIVLTPKAFAVLCYLVDRSGRLVSQNELLDSLWPDTFVQPEVLKTHILDVRTALGDSAKKPLFIETMPRRGYRFIANVQEISLAPQTMMPRPSPAKYIGRAKELELLNSALDKARNGTRQIVFVAGEIGVGKTTLTEMFEQQVSSRHHGIQVIRGQCVEGHGIQEPYYPVLEALGILLRGPDSERLVELLAARAPTWLAQFPSLLKPEHREMLRHEIMGATKERMVREICEALEAITAGKTLLLILEDVHWVDSSTVDLLEILAGRRMRQQLMVLATYRPVHIALVQHPLKAVKQRLLVHSLCQEIVVNTFSELEVQEYLAAKAGRGSLPDGLSDLIYRHSDGNPLFLVAVLDHLRERGFLDDEANAWRLNVPLSQIDLEVPASLRRMLELHIDRRLTEEERLVLEAGSVSGNSFFALVGAHAAEVSQDRFEHICEVFAERGQLVRSLGLSTMPDGTVTPQYQFVHAFYREVFYRRIAPGRCARLHKRTGEGLESRFSQQLHNVAAELAMHFEQSFDWGRAVLYLEMVADNEARRFAYYEAVPVLQHALELVKKLPDPESTAGEIRLLQKLGSFYFVVEDIDRSYETLEQMARRAHEAHNDNSELWALVQLVFPVSRISSEQCLKVTERALQLSDSENDESLKLHSRITCIFWRILARGWSSGDMELHYTELRKSEGKITPSLFAGRMAERALLQWASSSYKEGLQNIEANIPVITEAGNIGHRSAQLIHIWLLLFSGEWGRALMLLNSWIAAANKNGNHVRECILRLHEAWVRLNATDFSGVVEICNGILPAFANRAHAVFWRQALILAGTAECELGLYDQAHKHLLQVREAMNNRTLILDWYWKMLLQSVLSDLALKKNDLAQARLENDLFIKQAFATDERTWQSLAWEQSARISLAEGNQAGAETAASQALSLVEAMNLPLAAPRIYRTSEIVFAEKAECYKQAAHAAMLRLHGSLASFASLQKIYCSNNSL